MCALPFSYRLANEVQQPYTFRCGLHARCGRSPSLLQRKGSPLLIYPDETYGDQNGLQSQEAYPHPDVLRLAVRVRKELLHTPDPPVLGVVNPISHVLFRRLEPAADGSCSVYRYIIQLCFLSYGASLPGSFPYKRRTSTNGFAATKKGSAAFPHSRKASAIVPLPRRARPRLGRPQALAGHGRSFRPARSACRSPRTSARCPCTTRR